MTRSWRPLLAICLLLAMSVAAWAIVPGEVAQHRWAERQEELPNGAPAPFPTASKATDGTMDVEPIPPGPLKPRRDAAGVWTGSELVVWGGVEEGEVQADGAAYDPATRVWRAIAPAPLSARSRHVAVWTGEEMVVWGGNAEVNGVGGLLDGAAYDPATDSWRFLADAPAGSDRTFGEAVVIDRTVAIAGGHIRDALGWPSLLLYDLETDSWRTAAPGHVREIVRTGSKLVGLVVSNEATEAELVVLDAATGIIEDFIPYPVELDSLVGYVGLAAEGDRVALAIQDQLGDGHVALLDLDDRRWSTIHRMDPAFIPPIELTFTWQRPFELVGGRLLALTPVGATSFDPSRGQVTADHSIEGQPTVGVWTGDAWLLWGGDIHHHDLDRPEGEGLRLTVH